MTLCPHCGEPIADTATRCRSCGSDAETGWAEDVDYHSVELPEPHADDEQSTAERLRRSVLTRWLALVLVLLIGVPCFLVVRNKLNIVRSLVCVGAFVGTLYALRALRDYERKK
ncbi:MAG: zinc-ribbon domain-containing protein [Planctomycetota bacterium]